MNRKTIDKIVWWIPFKDIRNNIRNKLIFKEQLNWIYECKKKYNILNNSDRFLIQAYDVGIINNASIELTNEQNYGCGCFLFKK